MPSVTARSSSGRLGFREWCLCPVVADPAGDAAGDTDGPGMDRGVALLAIPSAYRREVFLLRSDQRSGVEGAEPFIPMAGVAVALTMRGSGGG
jgi:hypothetical protein